MARPREFDTEQALEAAMQLFWTKGYEATSVADLLVATRLSKGSLYSAFRSKHDLFLLAVKRYLERNRKELKAVFETAATPREALRKYLTGYVGTFHRGVLVPRGCFAVNVVSELAPHDEEVAVLVNRHFQDAVALVAAEIKKGQNDGSIRKDRESRALAELVVVAALGILTGTKGPLRGIDDSRLADILLEQLR